MNRDLFDLWFQTDLDRERVKALGEAMGMRMRDWTNDWKPTVGARLIGHEVNLSMERDDDRPTWRIEAFEYKPGWDREELLGIRDRVTSLLDSWGVPWEDRADPSILGTRELRPGEGAG